MVKFSHSYLFWIIAALIDWIFTVVGIFKFGNTETQIVANSVITNYGLIGFSFLGIIYLFISLIFYQRINYLIFIMLGAWHIIGAWSQFIGIMWSVDIFMNTGIVWYSNMFLFIGITTVSYYVGRKDKGIFHE